jgi:hypothetical protein
MVLIFAKVSANRTFTLRARVGIVATGTGC